MDGGRVTEVDWKGGRSAARQRRSAVVVIGQLHRRVANARRMFMGLCILDCWCLAARLARAGQ